MKELCVIALMFVLAPWVTGIGICLFKFFGEKMEKLEKWYVLKRHERRFRKCLRNYGDKMTTDEQATLIAAIAANRHVRSLIFDIDDLKIWKAFV